MRYICSAADPRTTGFSLVYGVARLVRNRSLFYGTLFSEWQYVFFLLILCIGAMDGRQLYDSAWHSTAQRLLEVCSWYTWYGAILLQAIWSPCIQATCETLCTHGSELQRKRMEHDRSSIVWWTLGIVAYVSCSHGSCVSYGFSLELS